MVKEVEYKVGYAEAQEQVAQALAPLGQDYIAALRQGFGARWVDVYENQGKRSGAYSWGSYGTNPFMLLNYQGNMDSMFTLAHELGHSMHSYFTRKTQPYPYGNYTLFVAEVASTLNEALLTHYLLKTTEDRALRMYIINHALETYRTTLYRQTLFAEFERDAHARAEGGESLTPELLCQIFKGLNDQYYGARGHRRRVDRERVGAHPALLLVVLRLPVRDGHLRLGGARQPDSHRGRACAGPLSALPLLRLLRLQHRVVARRRGGPLDTTASAGRARSLRELPRPT